MNPSPLCPVCSGSQWRDIGSRLYRASQAQALGTYARRRFQVLFQDWFPGATEIRLTSILCERCGMIAYRPRPEVADVDAKYRRLQDSRTRRGPVPVKAVDRARSREMCAAIGRMSGRPVRGGRVLDFGGGDGRLMGSFIDVGCECDLVDYATHPQPGVRRIGATLREIGLSGDYDWAIACHVLEHVADPLETVKGLGARLRPDGVLFVEVPMEIVGKAPLRAEPVTHINFFTRSSLRHLLEVAGLEVIDCRLASSLHPTGRRRAAVRAVARRSAGASPSIAPSTAEAERFLSPNPLRRLQCDMLLPRVALSRLAQLMGL